MPGHAICVVSILLIPVTLFLTLPRVRKELFKVCLSSNIVPHSEGPDNLSFSECNFCTKTCVPSVYIARLRQYQ